MASLTYKHPTLSPSQFRHLFVVDDPPRHMVDNIGRDCYLKLVDGMANPHGVEIDGVPVAPAWRDLDAKTVIDRNVTMGDSEPTDQPRLFRVDGLQYDYKREVCYRIYAYGGDTFGRPASESEVIFVPCIVAPKSDTPTK